MNKKLGLFGSYNRNNFGDDLLAYFISMQFSKEYDVCVFSTNIKIELPRNVMLLTSLTEFIEKCDLLVLGGGGLLTNVPDPELESQLFSLLQQAQEKQLPLYIISIGGDQKNRQEVNEYLGSGRRKLFSYPYLKYVSVRTNEHYGSQNSKWHQFEDILWTCMDTLLPAPKNNNNSYKIGIHLSNIPILRVATLIAELFAILTLGRIKLVYFKTHDEGINSISELSNVLPFHSTINNNIGIYKYTSALNDLNILISAKMHIGLLMLSINKPFLSFGGPTKAHNLLQKLNLEDFILPSSPRLLLITLIKLIFSKNTRGKFHKTMVKRKATIEQLKQNSERNLDILIPQKQ